MIKVKKIILVGLSCIFTLSSCYFIPEISPTQTNEVATITSSPTETDSGEIAPLTTPSAIPTIIPNPEDYTFTLQEGTPAYLENFGYPDLGCKWMGVAGQAFGTDGKPVVNLVVNIKGRLGTSEIDLISVTGVPEADIYNPGSYEIVIADQPVQSEGTLSIQLFDLDGSALSAPVQFETYRDCSKNLVIINFSEIAE